MPMELVLVGIVCLAIGAFAAILAMRNAKSGSIRENRRLPPLILKLSR